MYYWNGWNFPYVQQFRQTRNILSEQWGDVNGDGKLDYVYLTGEQSADSPFVQNILLHVRDEQTGMEYTIHLKDNSGYSPTVFLGDFTGDKVKDIYVSIASGGSGGYTYNELFTFRNNQAKRIYDNDWFYRTFSDISIDYKDHYKVRVVNRSLNKQYLIDISDRGPEYLNELYDKDGKLKKPTQGQLYGVSGAYPIDLQNDGVYELMVFQEVSGLYHADGLGYLQTPIEWQRDQGKFVPLYQMFSLFGTDLKK